jgi:hypothetical protein
VRDIHVPAYRPYLPYHSVGHHQTLVPGDLRPTRNIIGAAGLPSTPYCPREVETTMPRESLSHTCSTIQPPRQCRHGEPRNSICARASARRTFRPARVLRPTQLPSPRPARRATTASAAGRCPSHDLRGHATKYHGLADVSLGTQSEVFSAVFDHGI